MRACPSILRILWRDHVAFFLLGMVLLLWLLVAAMGYLVPRQDLGAVWWVAGVSLVFTVVLLPISLWRVRLVRWLFAHGTTVSARVVAVMANAQDIYSAFLSYTLDGRSHRVKYTTGNEPGFQEGEVVVLLVDPARPSRAVPRDWFAR